MILSDVQNIISLSYAELGNIGYQIALNFDNGYGKSQKQLSLIKQARLMQMELKTVLDHVEYDSNGDLYQIIRSTDEQINKSLYYLIDLSKIQDYSAGPTLFSKIKPRIITTGNSSGSVTITNAVIDCGSCNLSSGQYPSTGGTGTGGLILKGNEFYVYVGGTVNGNYIPAGSNIRAMVDSPGQTDTNWRVFF